MSEGCLKFTDDGCTSPDFLQNLFRKPLFSEVLTQSSVENDLFRDREEGEAGEGRDMLFRSFTNIVRNNSPNRSYSNSQKLLRSASALEDDKISIKKFKIFFKTLFMGIKTEEEVNQIWQNLQNSMNNPFAFDKFIQDIKRERQDEIQMRDEMQKQQQEQRDKQLAHISYNRKLEKRGKTPEVKRNRNQPRLKSERKGDSDTPKSQQYAKNKIRQSISATVSQIKMILLKGQRTIKQK